MKRVELLKSTIAYFEKELEKENKLKEFNENNNDTKLYYYYKGTSDGINGMLHYLQGYLESLEKNLRGKNEL